jgi:hypothetical protein
MVQPAATRVAIPAARVPPGLTRGEVIATLLPVAPLDRKS